MKKRMWFWCLVASLSLALNVACDEDTKDEFITPPTGGEQTPPPTDGEQTPPPTDGVPTEPILSPETIWVDSIEVLNTELTIGYEGGEIEFVTRTNQTWQIDIQTADGKDWLTVTDPGRAVADYTVKVAATKNVSKNERTATIYLLFDDAEDTVVEVTVTQEGRPMTATIPLEVELPNTPNYNNVGGNYNVAEYIAGSDTDMEPQLGYLNEEGDYVWQNWTVTDGWFGPDGPMNWGAGCLVCIKPNADGAFEFMSPYPGVEAGTEVTVYINYGNDVIVEVFAKVVGEEQEQKDYTVVGSQDVERTVTFIEGHGTVAESYTLDMEPIKEKLGGDPTEFLMSLSSGKFQDWSTSDGWFGAEGAELWGSGSAIFCMKPQANGTFGSDCCHPDIAGALPTTAKATFRYARDGKAYDVNVTVNVVAAAQ